MFGYSNKLTDTLCQLKFSAKQANRYSKKAENESMLEKSKLKKALVEGHIDVAKIYAENAVRKHKESLNYLRMSSRFDAVYSRVQSAMTMNQAVKNISGVTKELSSAMQLMNLEKVEKIMSKFESQFEDLDVRSSIMDSSMQNAFSLSAPDQDVTALMKQIADENGLEIANTIAGAPSVSGSIGAESSRSGEDENLSRRLAELRH